MRLSRLASLRKRRKECHTTYGPQNRSPTGRITLPSSRYAGKLEAERLAENTAARAPITHSATGNSPIPASSQDDPSLKWTDFLGGILTRAQHTFSSSNRGRESELGVVNRSLPFSLRGIQAITLELSCQLFLGSCFSGFAPSSVLPDLCRFSRILFSGREACARVRIDRSPARGYHMHWALDFLHGELRE